MKRSITIMLMSALLTSALTAEAKRSDALRAASVSSAPSVPEPEPEQFITDEEPWLEEVPDYVSATVDFDNLSDEQIIDELMKQPIMGDALIDAETLRRFVARYNPDFDKAIAETYITVGERYGIRGDIALCQSILETGWFRFADGTSVTPDQHNYCGLGVLARGQRGHSFDTIEQGVTAQIQHLYAYACSDPIPAGETILDPRFKLVSRGVAPRWADLAGRWAANDRYARSILKLYLELHRFTMKQISNNNANR